MEVLGAHLDQCAPGDYSKVGILGLRYKSVNFGAGKSPGAPDWCAQIDWDSARRVHLEQSAARECERMPLAPVTLWGLQRASSDQTQHTAQGSASGTQFGRVRCGRWSFGIKNQSLASDVDGACATAGSFN